MSGDGAATAQAAEVTPPPTATAAAGKQGGAQVGMPSAINLWDFVVRLQLVALCMSLSRRPINPQCRDSGQSLKHLALCCCWQGLQRLLLQRQGGGMQDAHWQRVASVLAGAAAAERSSSPSDTTAAPATAQAATGTAAAPASGHVKAQSQAANANLPLSISNLPLAYLMDRLATEVGCCRKQTRSSWWNLNLLWLAHAFACASVILGRGHRRRRRPTVWSRLEWNTPLRRPFRTSSYWWRLRASLGALLVAVARPPAAVSSPHHGRHRVPPAACAARRHRGATVPHTQGCRATCWRRCCTCSPYPVAGQRHCSPPRILGPANTCKNTAARCVVTSHIADAWCLETCYGSVNIRSRQASSCSRAGPPGPVEQPGGAGGAASYRPPQGVAAAAGQAGLEKRPQEGRRHHHW